MTPGETRPAYDGYEASKAIIQDCEDSLTNWVTQNAAVSAKLSTRARTLSQRRRNNIRARSEGAVHHGHHPLLQGSGGVGGQGHDLSAQDAPLSDRDGWVPAGQHQGAGEYADEREEEEEEEEEDLDAPSHSVLDSETGLNGEARGRNHDPVVA